MATAPPCDCKRRRRQPGAPSPRFTSLSQFACRRVCCTHPSVCAPAPHFVSPLHAEACLFVALSFCRDQRTGTRRTSQKCVSALCLRCGPACFASTCRPSPVNTSCLQYLSLQREAGVLAPCLLASPTPRRRRWCACVSRLARSWPRPLNPSWGQAPSPGLFPARNRHVLRRRQPAALWLWPLRAGRHP